MDNLRVNELIIVTPRLSGVDVVRDEEEIFYTLMATDDEGILARNTSVWLNLAQIARAAATDGFESEFGNPLRYRYIHGKDAARVYSVQEGTVQQRCEVGDCWRILNPSEIVRNLSWQDFFKQGMLNVNGKPEPFIRVRNQWQNARNQTELEAFCSEFPTCATSMYHHLYPPMVSALADVFRNLRAASLARALD